MTVRTDSLLTYLGDSVGRLTSVSFDLLRKSGSLKRAQNRTEFFACSVRLLVACPYAFLNFTCFKACEYGILPQCLAFDFHFTS